VRQWAENEHRAGLSTGDKVAAIEQLSLLGLSATAIAKRTKASKADAGPNGPSAAPDQPVLRRFTRSST
jgi:hypothetical protein